MKCLRAVLQICRAYGATQPRSADGLRRAKLFHLFDHKHFHRLAARHEFEAELIELIA